MNLFWASFLRYAAEHSNRGSIRKLDGLEAAWVNSALIINNGTYLTSPIASESDLKTRLDVATSDASTHNLPWAIYLYEPYLSALTAEQVNSVTADAGLGRVLGVQVMTADASSLKPPARPLPEVEFRRVVSAEDAAVVFDINLRSYGMPVEMGTSALETNAYYSDKKREIGFIAYVGEVPVSTASVIEMDGWLYVALVATDPDHRQKGYAETVMRHALKTAASELQISRTSLDASDMGAPLYHQMGYQYTGEAWSMYAAH